LQNCSIDNSATMSLSNATICNDLNLFLSKLAENRKVDDRIIHQLNTTIPTKSFSGNINVEESCKKLHHQVLMLHKERKEAIEQCISSRSEEAKKLVEKKNNDEENYLHWKKILNRRQSDLRLLRQEIGIEEIVHKRVTKAFYERCRDYYNMEN